MPLILLLTSSAFAARVYWLSPPDDTARAAVARTVPGSTSAPFDSFGSVVPMAAADVGPLTTLRQELDACLPLTDVFDGELQIMARLSKATADVTLLPTPQDRELLQDALVFQGYAVHRYFQDRLGTEPVARAYRDVDGPTARPQAWLDAASLLDAPHPKPEMLPDAAEQLAYDEVQAYTRVMPSVSVVVGQLAQGAEAFLDGKKLDGGPQSRVLVVPGRHYVHVRVGDTLIFSEARVYSAGLTVRVEAAYGPLEKEALRVQAIAGRAGEPVVTGALAVARAVGEPVYLALPGAKTTRLMRVDTGAVELVPIVKETAAEGGESGFFMRVALGAGWASSGDWYLQHVEEGAPSQKSTVNTVAPAGSAMVGHRYKMLVLGVGGDAVITPGAWHSLPTGDTNMGLWPSAWAAVGIPWLQATAGFQAPWSVGVGLQAEVPLAGPFGLFGRGVYGAGLTRERDDGPAFEPLPTYTAWGGISAHFGG